MKINEELSVLFWLFKAKKTKDGMIPIYLRITIKGIREDFSSWKKILLSDWNDEDCKANNMQDLKEKLFTTDGLLKTGS